MVTNGTKPIPIKLVNGLKLKEINTIVIDLDCLLKEGSKSKKPIER